MTIDSIEEELERLERTEITQPAHLIIQDLLLKTYHYIHTEKYTKASIATKKLGAEVCKFLGMRGVTDIAWFCRKFNALREQYENPYFESANGKKKRCHLRLTEIEIKMSESGFDFIVIMEEIKTQGDVKRAIKGILESLSAIDPYFELRKDIGTAEVVKEYLRKLDDLLSIFKTDDENIKDIVDAVRISVKNYRWIMSTVITGGIETTGLMDVDITGSKSKKRKVSKDYLTVKKGFNELLIILEIVLENPERTEKLWKDISEMAKETPKSMLPFGIHISPRESRGETSND